jgi:hypothetical protein
VFNPEMKSKTWLRALHVMRLPVYTTGRDGVLFTHIRNHLRVVSFVVAMVGVINTRSHRTDCIDLAVCSQFCHCTKWKNPRSPVRVITAIKTGAIIKHIPASSRQTKSDPVAPGPGGPRPSSAGQGPPRMEVPIENGRGQWWPSPSQRRTVSSETGQSPAGPRNFRDGMHRSRGGGGQWQANAVDHPHRARATANSPHGSPGAVGLIQYTRACSAVSYSISVAL